MKAILMARIFAAPLVMFGAAQQAEVIALIPADKQGFFISVVGFVVLLLRELTKTPGTLTKQ